MLQFGLRLLVKKGRGREHTSATITCQPNADRGGERGEGKEGLRDGGWSRVRRWYGDGKVSYAGISSDAWNSVKRVCLMDMQDMWCGVIYIYIWGCWLEGKHAKWPPGEQQQVTKLGCTKSYMRTPNWASNIMQIQKKWPSPQAKRKAVLAVNLPCFTVV